MLESVKTYLKHHPFLIAHNDVLSSIKGVVLLSDRTMMISSHPIVTSEDKGPIRGTLIMGRTLNSNYIQSLSKDLHLMLSIEPVQIAIKQSDTVVKKLLDQSLYVQSDQEQYIKAYALIRDIQNKPSMILEITKSRELYASAIRIESIQDTGLLFFERKVYTVR